MPVSPLTPPHSAPLTPESSPEPFERCGRRSIRAVMMRAGTSKGLFFKLDDLPKARDDWREVILAAMGSPDQNNKQLDGMGGGVSTQSKVAVVSRSSDLRADVDYLFIQVPVDGGDLDFSGNCGNMSSGVGPFAVEEGLLRAPRDSEHLTVRIRNVNTNRIIHATFAVHDGLPVETGSLKLDGTSAYGSPIRLDFTDPAGSMTGRLLPTGSSVDHLDLRGVRYTLSCVDAANPFVFALASDFGLAGNESLDELHARAGDVLMDIRAAMAVRMGLAPNVEAARLVKGTPKIALVGQACDYITSTGRSVSAGETDVWARPYSMGKPHPSIQMTGAVCVAAAAAVPGTIVYELARRRKREDVLVIGHGGGTMSTDSKAVVEPNGEVTVLRGSVYRTARRLMEGNVLYLGKTRA